MECWNDGLKTVIIDEIVKSQKPSLRGAKRRGNPVQRTVTSVARDLRMARKDPSIRLRRPQDDLLRKSDCFHPPQ